MIYFKNRVEEEERKEEEEGWKESELAMPLRMTMASLTMECFHIARSLLKKRYSPFRFP